MARRARRKTTEGGLEPPFTQESPGYREPSNNDASFSYISGFTAINPPSTVSASRLGNNSATHPTSHGFTAINSPTREPEDPTPATKRKKPNNPQNKSANARANSTGRKKKVEERQQGDDLVTSTIVMPSKIDGLVPLKPCDSTIKKPAAFRYQPHQTSDTLVTTFQKAVAIKEPVLSNLEQENRSVYPDNQTEFAIDNAEETELHHHLNDTNNLSVLPDPNQLYERSGLEREDGQLSLSAAHDEGLFDSDLAAHQLEGQVDQAKNLSSFNDYDNEAEDMFDDVDFDEWIEHEKLHTQVVAESTEEEMTMPSNDHASVQETNDPNQIHQNLEEEEDFLDDDDDDEIQELLRLASEASTFSSPTKSSPTRPSTPKLTWGETKRYNPATKTLSSPLPAPQLKSRAPLLPTPKSIPPVSPSKLQAQIPQTDPHVNATQLHNTSENPERQRPQESTSSKTPPFNRPPFPSLIKPHSIIPSHIPKDALRTCFRMHEALRVASQSLVTHTEALVELYALVLSSTRDNENQDFIFADIYTPDWAPKLDGSWVGWKCVERWESDSRVFLKRKTGGRMCRVVGRMERGQRGLWRVHVFNLWEADWEDVEWVKGIVCS